ncbi:MAG: magnesium transporter [Alphaproteobacteria bacterium]|nr:magnesium transporter [Alphaproteobacteria bacterium]
MAGEEQTIRRPEGLARDPHFIASLVGAAGDRDAPLLRRLLLGLSAPDVAEALEQAPLESARTVVKLLGADLPPEILAFLSWDLREEVLALLPPEVVARALGQLDTDDAAAVAADIAEDRLDQVLAAADQDTRLAVQEALSFEEETAGRLMQREFVAAPDFWNVGQVIDKLRASADDIPEVFFEIYVVDLAMRPVGAVPVSRFLRTPRETPVRAIMSVPQTLIRPQMDREEVAVLFQKYHLTSAPVVDDAGRLTGMVTVDDIVDVVTEESQEDLLKLSGVSDAGQNAGVLRSMLTRAPWIGVNLATALVSSSVIAVFADEIKALVALAVLMPVIASMGGNAGTQALAVAVRAIAARELTGVNAARMIAREGLTGLSNGLLFALLLGGLAFAWFGMADLAAAAGLAVLINFTCAGLTGILVPLTLQRAGADPAVSSSVFVTFVTDLVGFFSFLGLASLIVLV